MSSRGLIRFEDESGQERLGEPQVEDADEMLAALQEEKLVAQAFRGTNAFDLSSHKDSPVRVKRLLPVLRPADVPIVKCIGLNYMAHSRLLVIPDRKCVDERKSEKEDENRRLTHLYSSNHQLV